MISEKTLSLIPDCLRWRRHLHKNAELSFEEYETTRYLEQELSDIPNITIEKPTKTGLVVTLHGTKPGADATKSEAEPGTDAAKSGTEPGADAAKQEIKTGPVIAIRADIDALPIQEEVDVPFASVHPGVMHACGHDGHTAMLLAAVHILAKEQENLHGTVKFIFQHAEELPPGGAVEMVEAGVLDDVDEVYGLHLSSLFPTGHFGVRAGALTSATDRFDIVIRGKGGHSAFPEGCIDPVVIAGQVIVALQTIVARQFAAIEPVVLSICMLSAGQAYNIIPGEVKITGSTRSFSRTVREQLPQKIEAIVKGACDSYGASYDFTFTLGYASVVNDEKLTADCRQLIVDTFGEERIFPIQLLMPGEDYSAFSEIRPGFFVELGAGSAPGCSEPHHNAHYRMDEDALAYGVEYFCQLVRHRLG